ncbi:hypothetical protein GNI_133190 [Gregarina niphandrodes]|uniref:Uncharacterized protein n=1 Tax=Gregarina niphandrodes TaxID=110365 RepID=A0A023B149_GRENI|nr:hypothetical protein GNI_133190 [Gregarina niphandrodes]EZG46751.1 hypothetical protein GNI_133190 [Gregarina niphandrodes]|eukprot:XP_011132260.1 hypothetical protein GNI_133190 [Gregarina niphandrodes]
MGDFTILTRLRDAYPLVEDPGKDQNTKLRKQAFTCLKALSDQYKNQRNDTEVQSLVISCNQQYKF